MIRQNITEPTNQDEEAKLCELVFHTKKEIILKSISLYSIAIALKYVQ